MTAHDGAARPAERSQRRLGIDTCQEAVIYMNRDSTSAAQRVSTLNRESKSRLATAA